MPVFVENKYKFYFVYFFRAYNEKYHYTPMLKVKVILADQRGRTYKYDLFPSVEVINEKYRSFISPFFTKDFDNFVKNILRFAQKVVLFDEKETKDKISVISGFQNIPTAYSVVEAVRRKYELSECMPVFLDLNLLTVDLFFNKYNEKVKEFIGIKEVAKELERHIQRLKVLYKKLQPLDENEVKQLKDFKLSYDSLKLRVWTKKYRMQVFGIMTEAYRNITGHYFLPFAVMNGLNDKKIDERALRYASIIANTDMVHKIESFVEEYYKDRGILKEVVDEINNKQIKRISDAHLIAYPAYVNGNLTVLRCVPKGSVYDSYRSETVMVEDLLFSSVGLMLKGRTDSREVLKKNIVLLQGEVEI